MASVLDVKLWDRDKLEELVKNINDKFWEENT